MPTERLALLLETVGTSSVVRDLEKVSGATRGLGDKAVGASNMLRGLGGAGQQMAGTMQGAVMGALAAAATAVAAFGVASVKTYTELGQSVLAFQRASGASAEQSSALIAAFDDVGIAAEVGSKAIFQLGRRLGENSEKLQTYGVSAARGADGNVDLAETLKNVADAYQATTDPAARAELLTTAFGKSGQQLIPILERGRKGIDALYSGAAATGQILSQDDIQRAEDFRLAMDTLNDAVRELWISAGQYLVPALTDVANILAGLIDKAQKVGDIPVLGALLSGLPKSIGRGLNDLSGGADSATESVSGLKDAARDAAVALAEDEKAVTDLTKALLGVTSAQRANDAATRALANADQDLADARKKYNDLIREGAVDEEKVADARRSLAEATRSLGSAQRRLRDAQDEYNDAAAAAQILGTDTALEKQQDAADKLADAQDGVASAAERQQEAASDLKKAQSGDPEFNDKLAAAKQRVKDAEQGLADAQYTSSQRAYELNQALETQNTELSDNADAVLRIRSEWDQLLKLQPSIAAFLSGPMAALAGIQSPPTAPTSAPGYLVQRGEGPSWTPPTGTATASGNSSASALKTVGDIIINVKDAVTDPAGLARKIIWNIN